MHKGLSYLFMISGLFCSSDAFAQARNEEVIRRPSLLMLGDIAQSVGVGYGYFGHSNAGVYTSSSSLSESYSVSTEAAILDPDLVYLQFGAGLTYQQSFSPGTSTSTLLNWQYNILASAFDISYHPVTVNSSRTSTLVANGYTPSYTLTRTTNRLTAALLHTTFPLRLFYAHSTMDTQGGVLTSGSTSDSLGLGAHHEIRDVSTTDLSADFESDASQDNTNRSYSFSLTNDLSLDSKKNYRLSSRASLNDTKISNVPQRLIGLSEGLSARFGQALLGNLSDMFSRSSTLDFDNKPQSLDSNVISASLSHRLYQSLTTNLSGTYNQVNTLNGTESGYGALASLGYSKVLPSQSLLVLTGNLGRTVTSQNFQSSQLVARDEPHLVAQQGDRITPGLSGKLVSVISVKSLNPEIFYLDGIDYRVDYNVGRIEIIIGGAIAPGTNLFISYTVRVNQNLEFQTDVATATGTLSLFSGRYLLGADYSVTSQGAISGEASNQALVSSSAITVRADANYTNSSLGAELGMVDSTQEQLSRLGGHWTYTRSFSGQDKATFNVRDTYTMYGASAVSSAYNSNAINFSSSYSRRLFDLLKFVAALSLGDSRQGGKSSDVVIVRAGLDGNFRQLNFSMNGQTAYRVSGISKNRDDSFQLTITRAF